MIMELQMIQIPEGVKGFIFDLDGTLIDSMPAHYDAWAVIGKKYGFEFPLDLFYSVAGMPTVKIVDVLNEKYGLSMDAAVVLSEKEDSFLEMMDTIKPIEEVVEVVKRYHGEMAMSVGTGGKRSVAVKALEATGLDRYFNILTAADDVENHKPEPDTFLRCARLMGVFPEDCLVFEDAELGIKAAEAAGMRYIDVRKYLKAA